MSTALKIGLVALSVFGAYVFLGTNIADTHKFAFGAFGMGFTYLTLACVAVGGVAYKMIK